MSEALDKVIDIRAAVEERKRLEAEQLAAASAEKAPKGKGGGPDDPRFVLQCLANNERGDGILFAELHRDRYVYDKTAGRWLEYPPGAHHWQIDRMGRAVTAVEAVALTYLKQADSLSLEIDKIKEAQHAADARANACKTAGDLEGATAAQAQAGHKAAEASRLIGKRNTLTRRVDRLRGETGAKRTLFWAHSVDRPLAILGDEIDQRPLLFPCANGVIDLETARLRPGAPADWLVKASPVAFPAGVEHYLRTGDDCPAPAWNTFFHQILGDEEIAHFKHKLLGYCMTGLVTEHILTVSIGEGRNGKGTLYETVLDVLGDLAWVISPELILEQRNARSSQGPAADLMALAGRRLVIGSETDENRRISGSAAKQLSGGDRIKARGVHEREEINIRQTWKLLLQTNNLPPGLTKDFALLQRLVYIKFPYLFVDDIDDEARKKPALAEFFRQKDRELPGRLRQELPGILAWLVRGCLLWQREGLRPPDRIKADLEALRQEEDVLGQFIENRCERDADIWCQFKEFYAKFEGYHKETVGGQDKYIPSKKRLAADLVKRGYRKETFGGQVRFYGLRLPEAWA